MTRSDASAPELLVVKARSLPALSESATAELLAEVRVQGRGPALDTLVEHQLAATLDLAAARHGKGVEVGDLAQEGTIAAVVAVLEYAGQAGEEAFVRDTEFYEAAEIRARHEFGREPTTVELAAELGWPEERVAIVGTILNDARARYDSEIVEYLDDVDEDE
jgi:DNA-directed RNA polymerase sigma subunit (sigma70/sigma32)